MEQKNNINRKLINISTHTFITALVMLVGLMVLSIVLTYIIPRGAFGTDASGNVDYGTYVLLENEKGIAIWKGIFAPILLLGSSDGITVIMLSLFLVVIGGAFQAMNDVNGIRVIVNRVVERFKEKKFLLLALISLIFMLFGALLGLFEEMLTLLPIIVMVCITIGFDSFTGFLVSIVSCGFGFSSAITNPFTVLFASQIIGVNPLTKAWYRVIIFVVMYGVMLLWIFLYTRKITKDPKKSYTYDNDQELKADLDRDVVINDEKRIFTSYVLFFLIVLTTVITFSLISAIRDYTVVALIALFLFGGIITPFRSCKDIKRVMKSFGKGAFSVLPTIVFILLASSVKYILVEGKVLPTISHSINDLISSSNPYLIALMILGIVLVLEFFISSSTAKAMFVMSILSVLSLGLTKETLVLIYTFGDGYTNLLFPTSPVLLIGLSMIGLSYFKWLKKSALLFVLTFALVIAFLMIAIAINF